LVISQNKKAFLPIEWNGKIDELKKSHEIKHEKVITAVKRSYYWQL